MSEITRIGGNHRMSNVVRFQNVLYLAGQVPDKADAPFADQTREVLGKVENVLNANGSRKENILSAQIFITDMRHFQTMNEVWDQWVPDGHAPARATVEARLASPGKLIEVCVIAAVAD
ncbi:RidA family protein [Aromatoleum toluvorans]|uniref:RidA family protein n=1 Tax=Aromatoleum toluvorans TaxID=92002 RepID=A0ABX1Q336_9RHOO|nr:RidA family protein [Aromatoleum toluvorans]NMG46128.1 RidA family protein [Aromatoleum toluvorans]